MNFMMTAMTANFSPCKEAAEEKIHAIPFSDWLTKITSIMQRISLGPDWARKGAHFSCRKFPLKENIAAGYRAQEEDWLESSARTRQEVMELVLTIHWLLYMHISITSCII